MKSDRADLLFSQWVRMRDRECMRCFSPVEFNNSGIPKSHSNSHYFGRTKQSVRFDPENCDTLCFGCHRLWEKEDREDYRDFKVNQLGQEAFEALRVRSQMYHKKDYMSERIYWRQKIKEDYGQTYKGRTTKEKKDQITEAFRGLQTASDIVQEPRNDQSG